MHPHPIQPVPANTAQVAHLAFPKGNRYITLRDEIGTLFTDEVFSDLFSTYGQSAISPWQLALICIMQFLEDLTDRQAADFVAHMEDVLDVYHQPYDPSCSMIYMDEQPIQMLKETRDAIPMKPGEVERCDYQYERAGVANAFMFCEPLVGKRYVSITEHRTAVDWAHQIQYLLNVRYPTAPKIRLVMDQLNTHNIGSLYKAFPAQKARRLAQRLDIHHTPKHGIVR